MYLENHFFAFFVIIRQKTYFERKKINFGPKPIYRRLKVFFIKKKTIDNKIALATLSL